MKHFCSFSEAIREGAKFKPQGFKVRDFRLEPRTSCAIEAGIEALDLDCEWYDEVHIVSVFPYLHTRVDPPVRFPVEWASRGVTLYDLCWLLNDEGWTREEVADWLELEEEKLGFVTLVESIDSRAELSFDQQPQSARAGV